MNISSTRKGALIGFGIGLVVLALLYLLAVTCVPYFVAYPDATWPWYCVPNTYQKLVYFGFPMNVLSSDLSHSVYYAPLTLLVYALIGAEIGRIFSRSFKHES